MPDSKVLTKHEKQLRDDSPEALSFIVSEISAAGSSFPLSFDSLVSYQTLWRSQSSPNIIDEL